MQPGKLASVIDVQAFRSAAMEFLEAGKVGHDPADLRGEVFLPQPGIDACRLAGGVQQYAPVGPAAPQEGEDGVRLGAGPPGVTRYPAQVCSTAPRSRTSLAAMPMSLAILR